MYPDHIWPMRQGVWWLREHARQLTGANSYQDGHYKARFSALLTAMGWRQRISVKLRDELLAITSERDAWYRGLPEAKRMKWCSARSLNEHFVLEHPKAKADDDTPHEDEALNAQLAGYRQDAADDAEKKKKADERRKKADAREAKQKAEREARAAKQKADWEKEDKRAAAKAAAEPNADHDDDDLDADDALLFWYDQTTNRDVIIIDLLPIDMTAMTNVMTAATIKRLDEGIKEQRKYGRDDQKTLKDLERVRDLYEAIANAINDKVNDYPWAADKKKKKKTRH